MNIKAVRFYLGYILWIEGAFMLPAMILSAVRGETASWQAFAITVVILAAVGALLRLKTQDSRHIFAREGFVIVSLSWILLSLFGAMPFILSGQIPSVIDAIFETISGFTTTGSTILQDVEALSYGMLYWRSFTHWIGGMGVLVFLLAIMPKKITASGGASLHVLRAESPGPQVGKLVPKMRQSALILYIIYIILTVAEMIFLLAGGMPLFDSVTTAFATAGTGGFAIKNASMAFYDSYYLQTVVSVFMMLFGVNFSIYYLLLLRQFKTVFKNEELRTYIAIIIGATILIAIDILPYYNTAFEAFHHSYFQVSSIITTTGFTTADFSVWPEFSRTILLILMVIGASAGSTGGGMKVIRIVMLFKSAKIGIRKMLHPRAIQVMKIDGKNVDDGVQRSLHAYCVVYFFIALISVLLISLDNFGIEVSLSAMAACLNNIGPGLSIIGPLGNFSVFSPFVKIVLMFDMLIGRLEIFPMLLLFTPYIWRREK